MPKFPVCGAVIEVRLCSGIGSPCISQIAAQVSSSIGPVISGVGFPDLPGCLGQISAGRHFDRAAHSSPELGRINLDRDYRGTGRLCFINKTRPVLPRASSSIRAKHRALNSVTPIEISSTSLALMSVAPVGIIHVMWTIGQCKRNLVTLN
jgi:hypothetical protein